MGGPECAEWGRWRGIIRRVEKYGVSDDDFHIIFDKTRYVTARLIFDPKILL